LARARAAVSAVCSSLIAVVTVASGGVGLGSEALPVIAVTMPWAYVMSARTFVGSLSDASARCVVFDVVVIVLKESVVVSNESVTVVTTSVSLVTRRDVLVRR
jgi:hypothetical protein